MVNIYGPQDSAAKATVWSSLLSFAQHHQGQYVLFGDLNKEEVLDDNHNLKAIVLDRLWSDHSPILLHTLKTDYCPTPFKFFHSWFQRKYIDVVVNQTFVDTPQAAIDIDHTIDSSVASDSKKETRLQLHEIHNIDHMESMDLFQKARIKWDIEGDENTKFFHTLIKQNRRRQAIQGIMVDGTWVSNPLQVKEAFLDFYKDKFQSHVPQDDIELFISGFFATARLPPGTNLSFIILIPKVTNPMFIEDYRPISLIGLQYKIIAKKLANRLASVVISLVSSEQSAFISGRQILDGPLMLSEIMITGCSMRSFPFTYCGLPIGSSMKRLTHWQSLIDKFEARLSRWKAKLLYIGGRSTFVNAILGSVGIYYMSIFKVPETILSYLERFRSKIFWGFRSLKAFNLALLQKWRRHLVSDPNLLWVQVIKAIHGEEASLTHFDCKSKGMWANIIDNINHLHSKNIIPSNTLSYKFGCGSQVRLWIDDWTENSPLYHRYHMLYRLETHPNCIVGDRFSSGEWAWHWSCPITSGRCLDMIHALKPEFHSLSLSTNRYALRWGLTYDSSFTVGATRKHVDDVILPTLSVKQASATFFLER
ncbi:hypothetical protein Tco_1221329 [Tanacetum coccineum]